MRSGLSVYYGQARTIQQVVKSLGGASRDREQSIILPSCALCLMELEIWVVLTQGSATHVHRMCTIRGSVPRYLASSLSLCVASVRAASC
jgi:hypothetical protein